MTRFYLALLFSAASVSGFGLIVYAILAGSGRNRESLSGQMELGFSDSSEEPSGGIVDLDMGHEGLKHRGKESFDPDKHKPEPIEPRKKNI